MAPMFRGPHVGNRVSIYYLAPLSFYVPMNLVETSKYHMALGEIDENLGRNSPRRPENHH